MPPIPNKQNSPLSRFSENATSWIGSPTSIIIHTLIFIGIFGLIYLGFSLDNILLILTTAVSLEAIYLAIFIQMTVNRQTASIAEVGEDIEELGEEVGDLGENIEELSKDVDELSEDVDEIQEEDEEEAKYDMRLLNSIDNIESSMQKLMGEIEALKHSIRKD